MIDYSEYLATDLTEFAGVASQEGTVILYFTAPWCVPCKMLKPRLEQLEEKNEGLTVVRVDVESFPELATEFRIMSVPTMFFYAGGYRVAELTGAKQNKEIQEILDKYKD